MMLSEKSNSLLNDAMVQLNQDGVLAAGFIMQDGELLAVFDNVPGSIQKESLRKLLYQVREALKCDVEQVDMVDGLRPETKKEEMN